MNEAAELRMVRMATKRAKPRLRILSVYISHNQRDGGLHGISSDGSYFVQACAPRPLRKSDGVKGSKAVAIKPA
jgi:hypothetical protein